MRGARSGLPRVWTATGTVAQCWKLPPDRFWQHLCWPRKMGAVSVSLQMVTYRVDESTVVSFEIESAEGFRQAGAGEIAGQVRDAVGPAVEAARAVLDRVTEIRPERVELTFGVKVSGSATWLVARAAAEGNFAVTLSWTPGAQDAGKPGASVT